MLFKNVKELEVFYKKFENKSLEFILQYVNKEYPNISLTTNKGIAGQVLEAIIGNAPNSDPNPDVKNINVELKVLPLRKISNQIQPKERSKIKSINYNKIIDEVWASSEVKNKIEKILFLLYEHPTGKTYKDWKEFIFKGSLFYELKNEKGNIIQEDWEGIKSKVKFELADKLSEKDSEILGACTSGSGKLVNYGNNKSAKQRSYSLKHSYLKAYFNKNKSKNQYYSLNLDQNITPENFVLGELNKQLSVRNLKELVDSYKVNFSPKAKSSFSLLINRILKIDDKKKILELEEKGIVIKTVPVGPDYKAWESMSFPKFSLVDLTEENWDGDNEENDSIENEAVFKNLISQGFIFIPVIKEKEKYIVNGKTKSRYKDWTTWSIGESVYWKANENELYIIKKEWEKAKQIVQKGVEVKIVDHGNKTRQENNLLKSSKTKIIHIRPHANNSKDIDTHYSSYTNNNVNISWQSFWLNADFIDSVLKNKK